MAYRVFVFAGNKMKPLTHEQRVKLSKRFIRFWLWVKVGRVPLIEENKDKILTVVQACFWALHKRGIIDLSQYEYEEPSK